jgi:alpha-1,3-glucosyltransferase
MLTYGCFTSGSLVDPSWFALDASRGIETPLLKVFMRATVVVSEYLVYIPAVVIFLRRYGRDHNVHPWNMSIALVAILMQPATILVDHGHFQYNTVMLGLVVATLESIVAGRMLWSCIFFVAALGFKQMALYYAPAIFAYLLGVCFFPRFRFWRLFSIALVTVVAFALLLAPLVAGVLYDSYRAIPLPNSEPPLLENLSLPLDRSSPLYQILVQLGQAVHRIFPFARGLFEDKVANAWCALHTFYKLHRFPSDLLRQASLGATLVCILPSFAIILRHPQSNLLPLALASTAWGFFLFSFQVHEKSVLLPLLPMTLLLGGSGGLSKEIRSWVGFANMLGVWTLYPLLRRDELRVPYFVLTLLWAHLLGLPPTSLSLVWPGSSSADEPHVLTKLVHGAYYLLMVSWHILEASVVPPPDKPDLWVVLNVLIGASGFGIIYLWCTAKLAYQAMPGALPKARTTNGVPEVKKKQ